MADKYCKNCKKNNGVGHTCDKGIMFDSYEQVAKCNANSDYDEK